MFGKDKYHISYSAYSLWKRNKEAYRKHYYEGKESFETTETKFGHLIAEMLEKRDPSLVHIPQYSVAEHPIEVMIGNNRVVGRIDSFDEEKKRFIEFKTGHEDSRGRPPWTKLKVRMHEQLPFYAMLIKEKYGKVNPYCRLIWLETKFKKNTIEFDGHTLTAQMRELYLTGRVRKFLRYITNWEIRKLRNDLLTTCEEIKNDYAAYLNQTNGQQK